MEIGKNNLHLLIPNKISSIASSLHPTRIPADFLSKDCVQHYSVIQVNNYRYAFTQLFKEMKGMQVYEHLANEYGGDIRHTFYLEDIFNTEYFQELLTDEKYNFLGQLDLEHKWIQDKVQEIGYQQILGDLEKFTNYLSEQEETISGVSYEVQLYLNKQGKPLPKPTAASISKAQSYPVYLTFFKNHAQALQQRQDAQMLYMRVNAALEGKPKTKLESILSKDEVAIFNRYFKIATEKDDGIFGAHVVYNEKAKEQFYADEGFYCVVSKEKIAVTDLQLCIEAYQEHQLAFRANEILVNKLEPGEEFAEMPPEVFQFKEEARVKSLKVIFDLSRAIKKYKKQCKLAIANDPSQNNISALVNLMDWLDNNYDRNKPMQAVFWVLKCHKDLRDKTGKISKKDKQLYKNLSEYFVYPKLFAELENTLHSVL